MDYQANNLYLHFTVVAVVFIRFPGGSFNITRRGFIMQITNAKQVQYLISGNALNELRRGRNK